jgi:hypothetical protein
VRAPGLQPTEISAHSCRPRALTRRSGEVFKQALSPNHDLNLNLYPFSAVDGEKVSEGRMRCLHRVRRPGEGCRENTIPAGQDYGVVLQSS